MKTLRPALALVAVTLALAPLARAHPGHDGHELTWDFGHLAAHPGATLVCFVVIALAGWTLWRETRVDGLLRRKPIRRDDVSRGG